LSAGREKCAQAYARPTTIAESTASLLGGGVWQRINTQSSILAGLAEENLEFIVSRDHSHSMPDTDFRHARAWNPLQAVPLVGG
jgi:hypothetical protein